VPSSSQVVLLDMGGVLLDLHDPRTAFGLAMQQDEFMEKWLLSPSVRKFERGCVTTSRFASEIVEEFALPYSPEEFIRRLNSWPDALFDGVPELLESIGHQHRIALLSNTNEVHWNRDDIAGRLAPLLDKVFLSHQTRHLKPERAAFEDVLQHYGVDAGDILFFDDNPINIDAARSCGMQAWLTLGFDSLARNLGQAGITQTLI